MATIRQQLSERMLVNEGVDHLNLNRFHSNSQLSPLLAEDWQSTFQIPYMGTFRSCQGFALWALTGDEQYRGPIPHRELAMRSKDFRGEGVEEFRDLILYAKFYQLVQLGHKLIKHADLTQLPWTSYIKHMTGVREYTKWSSYPTMMKEFVTHILANSTSIEEMEKSGHFEFNYAARFPFDDFQPRILRTLTKYMKRMVGEDFVNPEQLPPLAGKVFNAPAKKEKPKADVVAQEASVEEDLSDMYGQTPEVETVPTSDAVSQDTALVEENPAA